MDQEALGNPNRVAVPAHELRIALQTILGFTQLLQSSARELTPVHARYLANVEAAANRLLEYAAPARARAPRLLLQRIVISVDDVMRTVVEEMAPAGATVGVDIEAHSSGLSVLGDREQLEQMLANLLTCALRSTEPGRRLHLRAHRSGDAVQITLTDTGVVVPHELTIARRLAEMMGGDLDWRPLPDGSTALSARLPAA